jgi:hypothetical protein
MHTCIVPIFKDIALNYAERISFSSKENFFNTYDEPCLTARNHMEPYHFSGTGDATQFDATPAPAPTLTLDL